MQQHRHETADLQRLHRVKQQSPPPIDELGPQLLGFFKNTQKRQTKLLAVSDCWSRLIPEHMLEHCALESFSGGILKVIVDSSAHLYELKQLLLAGVEQQLRIACKPSGLRKVTLKFGRWYEGTGADRKLRF